MLTVYLARNSICTQKVLITLFEKGLDYDTKYLDLFTHQQYDPRYLKLNPKGVVPTLVQGDDVIIESTLICEYLDEEFPEPSLSPKQPADRARMRLWSKAVDEGIFEATRELSFSAMFRDKMQQMPEEQRQARFRNVGDPSRRARFQSTYRDGVESPYVYYGIAAFEKLFKAMEKDLEGGRTWLVNDEYSLGDINLMPFAGRLEKLDMLEVWIADRPNVQRWWQAAKSRPSYAFAIDGQLTADESAAMNKFGGALTQRVRERRHEYLEDLG